MEAARCSQSVLTGGEGAHHGPVADMITGATMTYDPGCQLSMSSSRRLWSLAREDGPGSRPPLSRPWAADWGTK